MTIATKPQLELVSLRVDAGPVRIELRRPALLDAGKLYLVQGRSGSGKSSFARALLGLGENVEPPLKVEGSVAIRGVTTANGAGLGLSVLDGTERNAEAVRHMAYMPQLGTLGFIDGLSVEENARFFSPLESADAKPAMEALAARLRLWPLPTDISRASGGEQMRLSAVRALMPRGRSEPRPVLIVADEPTAGLDPAASKEVCAALIEIAREGKAVVMVISHEPERFGIVGMPAATNDGSAIRIHECGFNSSGAPVWESEAASLVRTDPKATVGRLARLRNRGLAALDMLGGFLLSPVALVMGLLGMRGRVTKPALRMFLSTAVNPGTWLFAVGACALISVTVGVFLFHLMPRRDLIEPLLLPDTLMGFGILLQLILIPMFAAIFATAKNGAAQAAMISSSVRGGLLDTLVLGRHRVESYSLVPAVLGQMVSLAICTLLASIVGLAAGALVFMSGSSKMSLSETVQVMSTGVETWPGWMGWLVVKTLVSGFVAGSIAAMFGLRPVRSERDVARAVHDTLLWGMFAVFAVQCGFVIAQFSE